MKPVVASVHFGIRDTCIAFAVRGSNTIKGVTFEDADLRQFKTPSCALLNEKGQLDCFGSDAILKYNELFCEGKSAGWKYFPSFPALKNTGMKNDEFYISDDAGESFSANTLLAEVVGYMKGTLLDILRVADVLNTDVTWVFIVPASWDSRAKICLTNSGVQVGLSADQILLITDAEAVSFTCLEELFNIGQHKKSLLMNWNDAITEVAEVESSFDRTIRVTFLESKHSNDMTTVQKKIQTLMGKWLDDGATIEFENFRDELEFTRELKLRLKKMGLGDIGKMILNVPASVTKRFHDFNLRHKRVYRATEGFVSRGKLRIHHGTIVPLVIEAFKETVSYIEEIVSRPKNKDLTDIILFGDLAEFSITADILRSKLRQSIHIAEDVGVAIPKGGVLFGLSPEIVTSRILRIAGDEKGCDIWATPKVIAQHQVFAAFDIGTTYSGYAYSVKNNPTEIWTNRAWNAGEQLLTLKTPTSVLLKPDKTFDSFGFEAENKYSSLVEDEEHLNWMLFRRFKMLLHQTKDGLHRDTMVEDISGKKMPALTIFSMAIRYLKEQLMETLHLRIPDISESDILYVITVPAIWSDGAKQFMKEAAKQAGIDSDQVGLALEPEAAAIWCQHIQTDVKGEMSKPGTQFMVVDVGGGTTDISVQEKQSDKRITEIHPPDGGAWGGTNVDKKFHDWFGSIFGQKTIHHFETSMFGEYLEFLKVFETKKRSNIGNQFFIRIPFSLLAKSTEAKKTIEMLGLSEKVRIVNEKLKVEPEIVKLWFKETISNISFNIKKVLQEPHLENVRLVMVVGGFAECQLLQSALKEKLPNVRVVIPEDAGIAVLKGAVEFAQRPHVIASRVMKCSYGINKPFEYDAKVHDSSKVVMENGQKVVHLFEKFVTINNTVKIGEVISKGFKPITLNETKVDIYSSSHPDPRYISDKGCTKIGEIIVKHNNGKTAEDKLFNVLFEFGKTEIFVRVIMRISFEEFGTTLDCL